MKLFQFLLSGSGNKIEIKGFEIVQRPDYFVEARRKDRRYLVSDCYDHYKLYELFEHEDRFEIGNHINIKKLK